MLEKIAILKSEINRDLEKINRLFKRFVNSYNEYQSSQEYSKLVDQHKI